MKKLITLAFVAFLSFGAAMAQQPQPKQDNKQQNTPAKFQRNTGATAPAPGTIRPGVGGQNQPGKPNVGSKNNPAKPNPIKKENPENKHCGKCPNDQKNCGPKVNADGIAMEIVRAFPSVKSIKKGEKTIEVYDASKTLLGYALYSKPASDGIEGYNGETPLLIAFTPKMKVSSVELLENQEGHRYVQTIKQAGLFKSWDGMNVKKARKKKVDTVSGATFTSRSIIESFRKALDTL